MKRPQSNVMKSERGQALVELALTLPMLLVVMFVVIEFGRALFQYNILAQATREGARVGVVSAESAVPTDGVTRMNELLTAAGIDSGELSEITCTVVPDYNGTGTKVVVAVAEMPFRWILQGAMPTNPSGGGTVSPGALTLRAETV
jgi:Flp pilus assembly protein TadG